MVGSRVSALTLFGLFAVSAMLVCYALESRSHWFVLLFAVSCALGSAYGFLQGLGRLGWSRRSGQPLPFAAGSWFESLDFAQSRWVPGRLDCGLIDLVSRIEVTAKPSGHVPDGGSAHMDF